MVQKLHLQGVWDIRAERSKVFNIISDFEKMPIYFPSVANSLIIVEKNGNDLVIEAIAKSFGTLIPVTMKTTVLPGKGYISCNTNHKFRTVGHEELLLEDIEGGTRIQYTYNYDISKSNILLRIIAKPLFEWFSMWYWKRAFVDKIEELVLNDDSS